MFNRLPRDPMWPVLVLAVSLAAPGCAKDPGAKPSTRANSPATATADAAKAPATEPTSPPVETAEFEPPYPQRQELFQPPRADESVATQTQPREAEVELKGFAHAGELKALLTIDGQLIAVPVGQVVGDLELISIAPPAVTLRRAGRSWVESLRSSKSSQSLSSGDARSGPDA